MTEHDVSAAAVVVVAFRADQDIVHAVVVLVARVAHRAAGEAARGLADDLHPCGSRNEARDVQIGAPHFGKTGSKHNVDSTRTLEWRSHHDIVNSVVVEVSRACYCRTKAIAQYALDLESVGS
jgi:hypothetical protein